MRCGGDAHVHVRIRHKLWWGRTSVPLFILSLTYSLIISLSLRYGEVGKVQFPACYAVRRLGDGRWEVIAADADRDQYRRPWCRVVVSERRLESIKQSIGRRKLNSRYDRLPGRRFSRARHRSRERSKHNMRYVRFTPKADIGRSNENVRLEVKSNSSAAANGITFVRVSRISAKRQLVRTCEQNTEQGWPGLKPRRPSPREMIRLGRSQDSNFRRNA
jgi:hypothetical protein